MAVYYLVEHLRRPAWDPSRRRREQAPGDAHAAFTTSAAQWRL